jgi:hypothetical protein
VNLKTVHWKSSSEKSKEKDEKNEKEKRWFKRKMG